jgi:threonine efflux protein
MLALLPLFGVWLLATLTPGPDFLVTVQYASARSRRHGIAVGLGVTSGIVVWASGSMLGLSVLLARVSWLYDIVRFAGAAYLIYLGVRTLWGTWRHHRATPEVPMPVTEVRPGGSAWRAWRVGFLTNIGNPKAAAFFGSLIGAFLPAQTGPALRIVVVAVMVGITVTWFITVAVLFGLAPVARLYRRARRWIDRVMATVLIALGARLAIDR